MNNGVKQVAGNTFSNGLLMDTYPTNLDNTTLSNCLNGTLLTYNGNEFMLQTDMGNGRIESAYLPPGYVPIGMKEYAGIIYVASYNPITNKGQLGSFPSPERNISSHELENTNKIIIGPSDFAKLDEQGNVIEMLNFFKEKIVLGDNNLIRPGDKFALNFTSSSTWSDLKTMISSFDNGQANKLLTLGVSIKDSKGNLKDITKTLLHFNEAGEITSKDAGYFLKEGDFTEDVFKDIDTYNKNLKNLNTYKENLIGELYITATVNSLETFEVSLFGEHSNTDSILNYSIKYSDVFGDNNPYLKYILIKNDDTSESLYLKKTKSVDKNKQVDFKLTLPGQLTGIFKYSIIPHMEYGPLQVFTRSGSVNLKLLNSGKISRTEWKYFVDANNNTLYIDWGLEAYLRYGEKVTKVTFSFYNLTSNSTTIVETLPLKRYYHGNFTEIFKLYPKNTTNKLSLGAIYLVQIIINTEYENTPNETKFNELLFTSTYFNKFYADNSLKDYYNKTIDLKISNNLELHENRAYEKRSEELYSSSMVLTSKPGAGNEYPFYYAAHKLESKSFTFENQKGILECEETLPFTANDFNFEMKFDVINEECYIEDLNPIYNTTDLSNHFITKLDVVSNTTDYNKVCYKASPSTSDVTIDLNTISEYIADYKSEDFEANLNLFRPYMLKNDPNGYKHIFGYQTNGVTPTKAVMFLRYGHTENGSDGDADKNNKSSAFMSYRIPNSYTPLKNLDEYVDLQLDYAGNNRSWTNLMSTMESNITSKLSLTQSPVVCFINGGLSKVTTKKELSWGQVFDCASFNKKGITNSYQMVLWKGNNGGSYYLLNTAYIMGSTDDNGSEVINGLKGIKLVFNNVYVESKSSYNGKLYKANNYTSTNEYILNYSGVLQAVGNTNNKTAYTIFGGTAKADITGDSTLSNRIEAVVGKGNVNTFITKINNNNTINISIETTTYPISFTSKAKSINGVSLKFENAKLENSCLIEEKSGKIFLKDGYDNNFRSDSMYYIGYDGKPYSMGIAAYFTGSALHKINNSLRETLFKKFIVGDDGNIYLNTSAKDFLFTNAISGPYMGDLWDDKAYSVMYFTDHNNGAGKRFANVSFGNGFNII